MAARASMAELITQLRLLADDPAGTGAMFTDQQLQDVLDQYANLAVYEQLSPVESVTTAGVIEYKRYVSNRAYWETDYSLRAGDYSSLTPSGSACFQGSWTFSASTPPPVLIQGTWYDIWSAAAEVWDMKAASYASDYDFSADGSSFSLSQRAQNAKNQAALCRTKSVLSNSMSILRRTDVVYE